MSCAIGARMPSWLASVSISSGSASSSQTVVRRRGTPTARPRSQVMRNGVLVGYVPAIEGSEGYSEEQIIDAILRTDYDKPIATRRPTAPAPAPPLPRKGGLFRRFMDGFRYR